MMNNYKYILLSCLIIMACTSELPFPDVEDNPVLVVNSLFSPEETLIVHVSESCHIQERDCSRSYIDNAEVILKDKAGSVLSILENEGDGIYSPTDYSIVHNTEYQLEVRPLSGSLEPIETKGFVPKAVSSTFVEVEEGVINDNVAWGFDIEIDDDPSVDNYYILEGSFDIIGGSHDNFENDINGYVEPHFSHYTEDPNAENKELGVGWDFQEFPLRSVYLPDANFNGEQYKTRLWVKDDDLRRLGPSIDVVAHIKVKSVSKDMYDYAKSLDELRLSNTEVFSEPQQVFTNIENGLGVFAGYAQQEFEVELPPSQYGIPRIDIVVENEECISPCVIKFSAIGGGAKLNYFWDFSDGNTANGQFVEHTFADPGTYTVLCEISDGAGSHYGSTFQVEVN